MQRRDERCNESVCERLKARKIEWFSKSAIFWPAFMWLHEKDLNVQLNSSQIPNWVNLFKYFHPKIKWKKMLKENEAWF